MTLSRKCTADLTTRARRSQSISPPDSVSLTIRERLMEPRLQLS